MMIVQYVEFSTVILVLKTAYHTSSVRPLSCIVSALCRFYAVIIYIHHFKRVTFTAPENAKWKLVGIGNMTNFEMSDTRYLRPFPL